MKEVGYLICDSVRNRVYELIKHIAHSGGAPEEIALSCNSSGSHVNAPTVKLKLIGSVGSANDQGIFKSHLIGRSQSIKI